MRIWRNLVDLDPSTERLVERDQDSDHNDDMAIKNIDNERQDDRYYFRTQQQARSQPPHFDQRPTIDWESFLSIRSLMVLLVENDDSTRHAIGALIRNCSYEVIAVSNGLEAWKFLKDVTNRVDIVLAELETPCLSGFDLLSKITSNKTRKNIPVIMMSSNDSMNIVFKCLSNGAVDFLVKPIRKNELKNLWRHVWRKCHNRSKSEEGSNNIYEKKSNNGSPALTFRNASDNDSITKSACSKRAQPTSHLENLLEVDEHVAMGKYLTLWTPPTLEQLKDMKKDKKKLGKEMVVECNTVTTNSDTKLKTKNATNSCEEITSIDLVIDHPSSKVREMVVEDNTVTTNSDTKLKAKNATNSCEEIPRIEFVIDHPSSKVIDLESHDEKEPSLELNLQRVGDVGSSSRTTTAQTRNILRRSDPSAFCRYNIVSTKKPTEFLNIGSCSSFDHTLEKGKIESMQHLQPEINPTPNQTDKPESSLNGKQIPIVTLDSDGSSLGDINEEEAPHFGTISKLGKGILGNAPNYESVSVSVGGRNVGCDDNTLGFVRRNRIAMREAALNRFRQKRKERRFKKKVSTRNGAFF